MTRQRRAILSIIETAQKHLDASQILRKAQNLDSGVDRVTVYRTLALLKRHGLVDELDLMHVRGEGHYYERKVGREHVHVTCLRCGQVVEFESPLFKKLTQVVERDCHFHVVVARLEMGGYCTKCRK
jgi:Fur family ferric uptake transcriptional regulator